MEPGRRLNQSRAAEATRIAVARPLLLVVGLVAIAANLRGPFTGVAPILGTLESVFTLSPPAAGLLTTLPLLAFGVISPFAAAFARKWGLDRALFVALLLIAGGMIVRAIGVAWGLFLGTAILAAGIAIGNVLLPSIVKRDFPTRVPTIMGICAVAMGGGGAVLSAVAVPLEGAFGWRVALAAALVLPLVGIVLWRRQLGARGGGLAAAAAMPPGRQRVWRSGLAWQVTLFMGTNSLLYYVLIAWLPMILTAAGLSPSAAGSLHGLMQLASAIPGLMLGAVVNRMKDQRLLAAAMGLLMGVALVGFHVAIGWATLWAFCFGFGSGGGVLLALMFMGLRTHNAHQAAALSGMAQCVGYLLAASGPTLAGRLHEVTGSWTLTLYIGVALAVVMAVFGSLAGRSRVIGGRQ